MKLLKYVLISIVFFSFHSFSKESEIPQNVVAKFLSNMKNKNYYQASGYITDSDLTWLTKSTKPLLNNQEFLEMHGLENFNKDEIEEFNKNDIFELWSYIVWEFRDKNFGSYDPKNILGSIKENENIAHVIVRDITNQEHEAVVYTLELEKQKWRLKLPRIIKASLTIFQKSF